MKNKFFKSLLVAGMVLAANLAGAQSFLQDPKYGPDPESRQKNVEILNFFNDAYKSKQYNTAAGYLKHLLQNAPKSTQNLYIYGANIYKNKLAGAKTPEEKKVYLDSLLTVYDLRISNFGDHPKRGRDYILGLKAQDYLKYNPEDLPGALKIFQEAVAAGGNNADPGTMGIYFYVLVNGFQNDLVETDLVIDEYDRLLQLLGNDMADSEKNQARSQIEALFAQSGAASCENLEKIYKPKYEADPDNKELLAKIVGLLSRAKCSSPFQFEVAEKYYAIEPTAAGAISLALGFEANKDFEKAYKYYDEAIRMENDPATKLDYMTAAASTALQNNNYRQAAEYAKQAIAADPNSGIAYFLLAQAYASGASSSCSTFDAQSVFWLVVDNLTKARELMQDDPAQVESITKLIGTYSANFPNNEECFFRTLENGQGYTVNCGWISGRTTVRARR